MNTLSKVFFTIVLALAINTFHCFGQSSPVVKPIINDTIQGRIDTIRIHDVKISNYVPIYIGPISDTIIPNYNIRQTLLSERELIKSNDFLKRDSIPYNDSDVRKINFYQSYYPSFKFKTETDSIENDLLVNVITEQVIKNPNYPINRLNNQPPAFAAYPVVIENKDSLAIAIGFGYLLYINLEYFDNKLKRWIEVDRTKSNFCATGITTIILHSNQMALTSVPLIKELKGERLRIRLGNTISNEFSF